MKICPSVSYKNLHACIDLHQSLNACALVSDVDRRGTLHHRIRQCCQPYLKKIYLSKCIHIDVHQFCIYVLQVIKRLQVKTPQLSVLLTPYKNSVFQISSMLLNVPHQTFHLGAGTCRKVISGGVFVNVAKEFEKLKVSRRFHTVVRILTKFDMNIMRRHRKNAV